jgi:hypothetical protein
LDRICLPCGLVQHKSWTALEQLVAATAAVTLLCGMCCALCGVIRTLAYSMVGNVGVEQILAWPNLSSNYSLGLKYIFHVSSYLGNCDVVAHLLHDSDKQGRHQQKLLWFVFTSKHRCPSACCEVHRLQHRASVEGTCSNAAHLATDTLLGCLLAGGGNKVKSLCLS